MRINLAIGGAMLSTLMLAAVGYAQGDISTSSDALLNTQVQTCPALSDDSPATVSNNNQQLTVAGQSDEVIDLTVLCYSSPTGTSDSSRVGSDINTRPGETPQSATEFDQLPQDRVDLPI